MFSPMWLGPNGILPCARKALRITAPFCSFRLVKDSSDMSVSVSWCWYKMKPAERSFSSCLPCPLLRLRTCWPSFTPSFRPQRVPG